MKTDHRWLAELCLAACLGTTLPLAAAEPGPLTAWYDQAANRWEEALPLGNGRLGAMVYGGTRQEHLQLNEDTLYSGWPGYRDTGVKIAPDFATVTNLIARSKFLEADRLVTEKWLGGAQACYQPLGDLFLDFKHTGTPQNYRRELDLALATVRIGYVVDETRFTRECFISAPDQVMVIRLTAEGKAMLDFQIGLTTPHSNATTVATAKGDLLVKGQVPGFVLRRDLSLVEKKKETHKYPPLWDEKGERKPGAKTVLYGDEIGGRGMRFQAAVRVMAPGAKITAMEGALRVTGTREVLLIYSAASSFNGYDRDPVKEGVDPSIAVQRALDRAAPKKYADLRERHTTDYQALFNRTTLHLGSVAGRRQVATPQRLKEFTLAGDPELATLYFQFARYLMISGSRPGTQPLNLQGLWNPHIIPPWASAYTININAEMNYWLAEAGNLPDCHEPLLRMVRELAVDGARVAKRMYGARGWVAHHNTTIWRCAEPVDGAAQAAFWPMAAGWLCEHLFEHYQFSRDENFLREAYPLMKGAAEFFLDWLVTDERGRLVTPVSTSPENNFNYQDETGKVQRASVSRGATMDLAIIRELFTNTRQAAEILGLDAEFREVLQTGLRRLRPFETGARGQLMEWAEDFSEAEPQHRHVSHLYGLHPAALINVRATPELAGAARRTLELRGDGGTGWSKAWKINFWARLEDGDHAGRLLGDLLGKSTLPNLFDTCPPFQIDGNFGGASGVIEMLLQSQETTVVAGRSVPVLNLLPARPTAWAEGEVKGLRARGGFTVDLTWKDGRLVAATLKAARAQACVIRSGEAQIPWTARAGEILKLDGQLVGNR